MRPRIGAIAYRLVHGLFAMFATFGGVLACQTPARVQHPDENKAALLLRESFDNPAAIRSNWIAVIPEIVGASSTFDHGEAHLVLPSEGVIELRHLFDPYAIRGRRMQVTARIRVRSAAARAYITLTTRNATLTTAFRVLETTSRSAEWQTATAVFDTPPDALQGELALVLRGAGAAEFDDVVVVARESLPHGAQNQLSAQQLDGVTALARASAAIRFRHPSDQVAELDWNTFLPLAMEHVLMTTDRASLLLALRDLFKRIAPTVNFDEQSNHPATFLHDDHGSQLARWVHVGLGPDSHYSSRREGRDDDLGDMQLEIANDLRQVHGCKTARLHAAIHDVSHSGRIRLYSDVLQSGETSKHFEQRINPDDTTVTLDIELPSDARGIRLGFQLEGRSSVILDTLALGCSGHIGIPIDIGRTMWLHHGMKSLYFTELRDCNARTCMHVGRQPVDNAFDPTRDILDIELQDGLWAHIPLAVWTDGRRTFPEVTPADPVAPPIQSELALREAAIATAWGILSLFYPYFVDQGIDWSQTLRPALVDAAAAHSLGETQRALGRLVAAMRDGHARITHPALPMNGTLPVALRRFGDKLIVVGVLEDYARLIPTGTEVTAIDGIAALQAYDEMSQRASAATPGWTTFIVPAWLTFGPLGTFSTLRVRGREQSHAETEIVLPRLSRALYDARVREARPTSGAQVAPGVYYFDLDGMTLTQWQSTIPRLLNAKSVIFDLRGYITNAAFTVLGHFSDIELPGPRAQIPILGRSEYATSPWTIRPIEPRIHIKPVVLLDGRAVSASETVLQIVKDQQLATLIGEPSAGTNGNVKNVALPYGFVMRFSGMRILLKDDSAIQGRGILPDLIVHPTVEGVREGRDELLETAISYAQSHPGH